MTRGEYEKKKEELYLSYKDNEKGQTMEEIIRDMAELNSYQKIISFQSELEKE